MPAFNQRVLRATLEVKSGRTATYGEIAAAIGEAPASSRAVGAALGANHWPLLIPCHRVTGAHGKMTGFSGPGGVQTKTCEFDCRTMAMQPCLHGTRCKQVDGLDREVCRP